MPGLGFLALMRISAISLAVAFLSCSAAWGQNDSKFAAASKTWQSCIGDKADALANEEVTAGDLADAIFGLCSSDESNILMARLFRGEESRTALEEIDLVKSRWREKIIARIVHIRIYGEPPPAE